MEMFTRAILNFRRGFPKCKHRHELFSKSIIEISLYDFCYLASIVLIHKCSKISLQFRLKNLVLAKTEPISPEIILKLFYQFLVVPNP